MMKQTLSIAIICLISTACGEAAEDKFTVYSCQWKDQQVCEEYMTQQLPDGTILSVDEKEAEQRCTRYQTTLAEYGNGTFAAEPCPQANTLGRCVMTPSYQARRYYGEGFSGVTSSSDPLNDTIERACGWLDYDPYYERPPYSD